MVTVRFYTRGVSITETLARRHPSAVCVQRSSLLVDHADVYPDKSMASHVIHQLLGSAILYYTLLHSTTPLHMSPEIPQLVLSWSVFYVHDDSKVDIGKTLDPPKVLMKQLLVCVPQSSRHVSSTRSCLMYVQSDS